MDAKIKSAGAVAKVRIWVDIIPSRGVRMQRTRFEVQKRHGKVTFTVEIIRHKKRYIQSLDMSILGPKCSIEDTVCKRINSIL